MLAGDCVLHSINFLMIDQAGKPTEPCGQVRGCAVLFHEQHSGHDQGLYVDDTLDLFIDRGDIKRDAEGYPESLNDGACLFLQGRDGFHRSQIPFPS